VTLVFLPILIPVSTLIAVNRQHSIEINSREEFLSLVTDQKELFHIAFQNINFQRLEDLESVRFNDCIFLGCEMDDSFHINLIKTKNLVFPNLNVPYNPYRSHLYTSGELYENFDPSNPSTYELTPDHIIYNYYVRKGKYYPDSIYETLAQKLHDHSITDALMDIIEKLDEKKIVAIMGGHGLGRDAEDYRKVVLIAKSLVESGYFILSGGGPGAMEATHLGSWLAGRKPGEVREAIRILSSAPHYDDRWWLTKAFEVIGKFPRKWEGIQDIGIPTFLYGHEKATPFAGLIAKYFENSVREEGLLGLAFGGIVYTPGSAGTIQEIFQDATQNHYKSYGLASPMIFLNKEFWTETKPIYPLLYQLAEGKEYQQWLGIYDEVDMVLDHLKRFLNE
jgi:predicted Rossmann-fold nucleotide-binding protein